MGSGASTASSNKYSAQDFLNTSYELFEYTCGNCKSSREMQYYLRDGVFLPQKPEIVCGNCNIQSVVMPYKSAEYECPSCQRWRKVRLPAKPCKIEKYESSIVLCPCGFHAETKVGRRVDIVCSVCETRTCELRGVFTADGERTSVECECCQKRQMATVAKRDMKQPKPAATTLNTDRVSSEVVHVRSKEVAAVVLDCKPATARTSSSCPPLPGPRGSITFRSRLSKGSVNSFGSSEDMTDDNTQSYSFARPVGAVRPLSRRDSRRYHVSPQSDGVGLGDGETLSKQRSRQSSDRSQKPPRGSKISVHSFASEEDHGDGEVPSACSRRDSRRESRRSSGEGREGDLPVIVRQGSHRARNSLRGGLRASLRGSIREGARRSLQALTLTPLSVVPPSISPAPPVSQSTGPRRPWRFQRSKVQIKSVVVMPAPAPLTSKEGTETWPDSQVETLAGPLSGHLKAGGKGVRALPWR